MRWRISVGSEVKFIMVCYGFVVCFGGMDELMVMVEKGDGAL